MDSPWWVAVSRELLEQCCLVRVMIMLCARETLCDVCIICQESDFRELKQARGRLQQEPHKFAYLTNEYQVNTRGIPVSTCKYADDCTLYELVSKDSVSQMQAAVTHLESWAVQNKMELNAKKTKDMWITFKKSCPTPLLIIIGPTELKRVSEFKLLGVYVLKHILSYFLKVYFHDCFIVCNYFNAWCLRT